VVKLFAEKNFSKVKKEVEESKFSAVVLVLFALTAHVFHTA
jgi:hypothetical protein